MSIALKAGADTISTAYTTEKASTPTQIINKALNGTTYVQNIGAPATTYKLRAVIDNETARNALDNAWADGTPLTSEVTSGGTTTTTALGVITGVTYQGPLPGGKYLADITTAV